MRKRPAPEFWRQMLEHIDASWRQKKKRPYPFSPKDCNQLRLLCRFLTEAEIMALWDCYLAGSPFHGPRTGYLVHGFYEERSVLLEDPLFKTRLAEQQKRLGMLEPAQMPLLAGLGLKMV